MIKTFLQWHRTADVLPDDEILVVTAFPDGDVTCCFLMDGQWWSPDAFPTSGPPQWWADFPVGPRDPEAAAPAEPSSARSEATMTDREVMQQALEALELMQPEVQIGEGDAAIEALRARLAEPEPEPVFEVGFGWLDDATKYPRGTKLYTTPPARSPLTDEEIDKMWRKSTFEETATTGLLVRNFARAIERKITGGNDD